MMEYFYRYVMTPIEFQNWKTDVIHSTGLGRDALHVYFGLFVFMVVRFILGQRWWSGPTAWAVVAGFAFLGEALDYSGRDGLWGILLTADHRHDIVNTLFWPTILLFLGAIIFARAIEAPPPSRDRASTDQLSDESLK